jgi:nicotinamide-nucleotide amidase
VTVTPVIASARLLAIGSELLALGRTDTNSPHIAARLHAYGVEVQSMTIVGDEREALADAVAHAVAHADLVVCTGGLGPTEDDRTRDVVAEVVERPLVEDVGILAGIRDRFGRRGLTMPEINRRQAMVPDGAAALPNRSGTAPGLWVPTRRGAVLLLPGPPREMRPMLDDALETYVVPRWGRRQFAERALVVAGRSESWVDERSAPVYEPWTREPHPITTTILASLGVVELHLSVHGDDVVAMAARLDEAVAALAAVLGDDLVSTDGTSLEAAVGHALVSRAWRVALAESCTGGLVTSRLTDVPGSSAYVDRTAVAYSNAAKVAWLDVPEAVLAEHGAVSEPVAVAMAEGLRRRAGVDVTVAVTGIAGPGGGAADKPVGLVCFAVSGAAGTVTRTARFTGDRQFIKSLAATTALDLLRRYASDAP